MSVRGDIADAGRAVIRALAIPGLATSAVVIRKGFVHDPGLEAARQVVLVSEDEIYLEETTGDGLTLGYPLTVGIVMERGIREEQAKWLWDVRQALRKALFVTGFAGAPTVHNCEEFDPRPGVDVSSWADAYDVSAMRFTYRSDEGRTA
jgi:hypothetical protein